MIASGTTGSLNGTSSPKKSIQLIVFAPINSDMEDDEDRIYMVCPSSLKVVEVIEKYDDEAIEYLSKLGKKLKRSEIPAKEFTEELDTEFEGEIEVAGEDIEDSVVVEKSKGEKLLSIEEELDEDLVAFAGGGLGDIFPDDPDELHDVSDIDMADAISLLDMEDDESDLEALGDFVNEDELPEL